jgi:hypothetical protein
MQTNVETICNLLIALLVLHGFLAFMFLVFMAIIESQLKQIRKLLEKDRDS